MCVNGRLKIGYFADGPWAHEAMKKLMDDSAMEIRFICLRYDKRDSWLEEYGKKNGIPVIWHENINSREFREKVIQYGVDIFVSMSFNQIFRKDMIYLPSLGTINCHAGKLPFYRGRNILNWALINDEKEFGITVHYVDEGIDTGDIILQKTYPISDEDDYGTLLQVAYKGCAEVLYEALQKIGNGTAGRIKQSSIDKIGMYCGARCEGDEVLDWNQTSRDIFNFVRAVTYPGPCARSYVDGSEVKIVRTEEVAGAPDYKGIPGQVLGKDVDGYFVKTKDNFVKITKLESDVKIKAGCRFSKYPTARRGGY